MTYTDKDSFHALENASGDADTSTFRQLKVNRIQIQNTLIVIACHSNKILHLTVRDDKRTAGLAVIKVTHRYRQFRMTAKRLKPPAAGMDKNQVVNGRDQFT